MTPARFYLQIQGDDRVVLDGDTGERVCVLAPKDAANYVKRLNIGATLADLLGELRDAVRDAEADGDPAFERLLDTFDEWYDELRTEGRLACPECGSPDPFRCDRPGEDCPDVQARRS